MDTVVAPSSITIEERRSADGLDAYVPRFLRGGALYDPDVDRFFLDLPLNGVRSRHSLRAYGYDITVWLRFLADARDKTVWEANRKDVEDFHRIRRRGEPGSRISAASWNRSVAAIDKLYEWGVHEGLLSSSPFSHREVWRRNRTRGQGRIVARNDAFERRVKRSDIRFVTLEDFRRFRDTGLRGLAPDGVERPGARDRNGLRNALFAEMLVVTGLRLEEASFLLAFEVGALPAFGSAIRQTWFNLPAGLTKGERGRAILFPDGLLQRLRTYIRVERAHAASKFKARQGWQSIEHPIFVRRPVSGPASLVLVDGRAVPLEVFSPDERQRLIVCDLDNAPAEPAVLWLTEVGQPVRPNSWEVAFARACRRCRANGFPIDISPHQLRHTFAVHMLAMLIQRQLEGAASAISAGPAEGYRRLLGDPLQQVQRLLGHASLETTSLYLDHIATRADTVDTAVAELLALLPSGSRL
ncbi:tyrosine-type recombinase/integrase [Aminobacter sp. MET-1]|uniref:tyrosine-type recombinase/integrase n=1 Tax=Aminobacter sp. MET-1 TaxID=2951085 RepID=UPI00226A0B9C|nr:site-specific integrase [Aminobacter sp. MET-1]MCX8571164.1 site-specific integrase [Aminobacter sp. MET-1]MCX8573338.1 site-specific integrase [Aminobacter sp. MET-1]